LATETVGLDRKLDAEALQIDDDCENDNGREEIHNVGEIGAVESLLECASLVLSGEEEMNKRNDGAFEFRAATGVDSCWGEGFPNDRFAHIGSDEKRDARTQPVALLEELIEQDDDHGGRNKLDDEEKADTATNFLGRAIETGQDGYGGVAKSNDHGKELLGSREKGSILFERMVNLNQTCAGE